MEHRLLFVNHVAEIAGAEESLLALLGGLDRTRVSPVVASPEGALAEAVRALDVPCHVLPLGRLRRSANPLRVLGSWLALRRRRGALQDIARRAGARLIHANSTTAQLCAGPVAAAMGLPCVWHVRDLSRLWPVGRFCARHAQAVIACSGAVARHVREATGAEAHVIHNGLDADAFASSARGRDNIRSELGLPPDAFVAAQAGQIVPWKRHEDFLRALARPACAERGVVGLIVGDDLFGEHRPLIRKLQGLAAGLGDRLRFLGWRDDMAAVLGAADALVVPSDAEPFGRVALEAMAVGKPVVGSRAGGLPEIVLHEETGLLTPPRAPGDLAAALARLADDRSLARCLGEAGARRVRDVFGVREHARAVQAVYDALLGGGEA